MGGVARAVAAPIKKVAKKAESVVEAASFLYNPAAGAAKFASKALGVKADAIFDPLGTVAAQGAESFIDKPKEAKEQATKFAAETDAANKKFQREIEGQRKQSDAEGKASKDLIKARKRQDSKRKSGRDTTIATGAAPGSAGSVGTGSGASLGGSNGGRKSLLGL